ncbi:uncharacterized protein LOC129946725 [Eupeodes corollae]|uniref:uncharacterized protein LOC129946725 n=1 Tax=Eupeodes corollae TaxID=290404 RepID=UPI002490ECCA|nr:uncharacterized protein LOC129946725 [Eupeodes corollae]XP_055912984.1 uncharacterized protein LOC129946725 [Eupeodes corollae]XP_055912985.1 uncharacterized protein LOC129946725 [Eupeodes corollae]
MVQGLKNKMFNPEVLLLVTCVTLSTAIRVDFGTKGGPIVPAAPTTRQPAPQPYRNPAPVWEDQSNDIPNPNKYQYVLPPPSRPKPETNNYKTSSSQPIAGHQKPREFVFGKVISPDYINSFFPHSQTVSAFSPQFIPNYGFKYHAIVPSTQKTYYTKNTDLYYNDKFNKFNGKYNVKTKKYKAFEKAAKYNPSVYYSNIIDQSALSFQNQQQLPLLQAPQPFRLPTIEVMNPQTVTPAIATGTGGGSATTTIKITTPKVINYSKDDLYSISKNYKLHHHQTQSNSFSYESNKIRR